MPDADAPALESAKPAAAPHAVAVDGLALRAPTDAGRAGAPGFVVVASVDPASPFAAAGVQAGDLIETGSSRCRSADSPVPDGRAVGAASASDLPLRLLGCGRARAAAFPRHSGLSWRLRVSYLQSWETAQMAIESVAERRSRRLTAVMLADVVDYSRMMSRSEDETHARVARRARELIDPAIAKYGGCFTRSMGDGILVEFLTAVDAVHCALDIQRGFAEREADDPHPLRLRIGINTGDVLVDQRDIYGNSVNIAARLEAFASPGKVCVSRSIYDQTRAHPEFFFADRGLHRVKNIPYPIQVYEVAYERIRVPLRARLLAHRAGVAAAVSAAAAAVVLIVLVPPFHGRRQAVARTNTLVVLPFKNVDGNASDDYLADAITDDLTTELSRLRRAWVIASGTAFAYKGKGADPRAVGRELHVRYALEGSVQRAGTGVRVNAQLIDTESGTNLWADSFADQTSSLIGLQDDLMGRIAASLNDEVETAGKRHEIGTFAADGNPLDERMRAMAAAAGYPTPEKYLETRRHAEAGLQADPDNARLLGLLANVLMSDVLNSWNGAGKPEVDRAEATAKKAIGLDPNVPLAHYALGWVHRLHGDHKAALAEFNEAVRIDPNLAKAYAQIGNEMVFLGDAAGAVRMADKAAQFSPKDPSIGVFLWVKGRAYFAMGDYPNAISALAESVRVRPNLWFPRAWLAAAYALTGQDAKAQATLADFEKAFNPPFTLDRIARYYQEAQFQNPTHQAASAALLDGLRKAGLK
jgi:adenylate cyclase